MNLLEVWIDEIISEEELDNGKVKVKAVYTCWGARETKVTIYSKKVWERIKERGYYLA